MPALFALGRVVATPGVLAALESTGDRPEPFLSRHLAGDWGELCDEDKVANDSALKLDGRLLSAYRLGDGTKIWIITEADRSSTCLLLPEEY